MLLFEVRNVGYKITSESMNINPKNAINKPKNNQKSIVGFNRLQLLDREFIPWIYSHF
jgi:hypothetical protein